MYFYQIWVRSNHYHGKQALSYSSKEQLAIGELVLVPLKNEIVLAVVMSSISRPPMTTKDIDSRLSLPPLPYLTLQLMKWLFAYYPSPLGVITQQFIPANLTLRTNKYNQLPTSKTDPSRPLPELTHEQQNAYKIMRPDDTYLLHGRTGSGKTRLYLELTKDCLATGRSAIILTPEISLTTQLHMQFERQFHQQVVLLHSTLSGVERRERWLKILISSEPLVIIGPRSAIFSPLKDIGLIILDEAHEPAYKQEQAPYYLTSRVAAQLRNLAEAKLILGSATPLVADYYLAQSRQKPIIRLNSLAVSSNYTITNSIIDAHDRSLFNRSRFISQPLLEAMDRALSEGNQSMLYLNRRGTARLIICENCDWQAHCPHCELPLTYHGDKHQLRCHLCNYQGPAPISCPECKNPSIKYLSIGTKAVVDEVSRLFPNARVQRFDADNLKNERLEVNYEGVKDGEVDIIIGTQLLAKGLDLPKLNVLGVLLADSSLQLPDFSVNERTYQLLQQVIGRVGRGHVEGRTFIQTYQPNNPLIISAVNDDWESFYEHEINDRRLFNFPPFTHLLKLSVARASSKSAEQSATKFGALISSSYRVVGPAPAFHEKQAGKYRWQLVVKANKRSSILQLINELPSGWSYDIDPVDLI